MLRIIRCSYSQGSAKQAATKPTRSEPTFFYRVIMCSFGNKDELSGVSSLWVTIVHCWPRYTLSAVGVLNNES